MTLLEVVNLYKAKGHKVSYRVRSDGGIIITSVDGRKFTRAGTGNKYLREITGQSLSGKRAIQTSYNVGKFIKLEKGQHKATSKGDDPELIKLMRKVQGQWRKNQTIGEGKVNVRNLRWYVRKYGKAYAKAYLERRLNYSKGIAYEENVYYWADTIKKWRLKEEAQTLLRNVGNVPEKLLQKIHDIIYEKGTSKQEKQRQIKDIINSTLD